MAGGISGKGNEGVAGNLKMLPGSIGAVELIYARRTKSPTAVFRTHPRTSSKLAWKAPLLRRLA